MVDAETLLSDLGKFLGQSFKDAIVWEQRDAGLLGKYVYLKYEGKELGVFMGYHGDDSGSVKTCITFFFAHPTSLTEEKSQLMRLFHKLLIRLNLKLKGCYYKIISGRSPALMRTMHFGEKAFNPDISNQFFRESIEVIKACEPVYKDSSK
jgi:hypothetical protein